jgi:hypothetical protein
MKRAGMRLAAPHCIEIIGITAFHDGYWTELTIDQLLLTALIFLPRRLLSAFKELANGKLILVTLLHISHPQLLLLRQSY